MYKRQPKVIVKDRTGKTLVKNTDYTVSYAKGRKYVGKYAVTVSYTHLDVYKRQQCVFSSLHCLRLSFDTFIIQDNA